MGRNRVEPLAGRAWERGARAFMLLLAITLLLAAIPFAAYGWARLTDAVPTYEEWARAGGNHGPWGNAWSFYGEGQLVFAPMMTLLTCLPPLTLAFGLVATIALKKARMFVYGLALGGLQIALAIGQLAALYWLVD